jgi:hypothetical protein
MQRKTIIKNIRQILLVTGEINPNMIGCEKPIYKELGKQVDLIETLHLDSVEVVSYINETEINNFHIDYTNLSTDLLSEILLIIDSYYLEENENF